MVAVTVAERFGVPSLLIHAGSDVGRLAKHLDLHAAYSDVLTRATRVATSTFSQERSAILDGLGITEEQRIYPGTSAVEEIYSADPLAMDVRAVCEAASVSHFPRLGLSPEISKRLLAMNEKPFDPTKPTVGVYGKIGHFKGTFELLEALAAVAEEGRNFNFLTIAAGNFRTLSQFYDQLSSGRLEAHSWVLPPVAPWRIPAFLAACDAAFYLETDFPISFHNPRVAREVLAAGTCLILSMDQQKRLGFSNALSHNQNVVIVNIKDHEDLTAKVRALIRAPEEMSRIGRYGRLLSRHIEGRMPDRHMVIGAIEILQRDGILTHLEGVPVEG